MVCSSLWLLFFSFSATFSGVYGSENRITFDLEKKESDKFFTLLGNHTYIIDAIEIPTHVTVVIFQVHSQRDELIISEQSKATIHNSIKGTNIGMAASLQDLEYMKSMWLYNPNYLDVRVLISLKQLDLFGPIPGGCNMEFPTEIAPFLRLKTDTMRIYLEYQHASFGSPRNDKHPQCSQSSPYISYDIYMLYLEENNFEDDEFFKKVGFMTNVSLIKEYATKAKSYATHPDTRYSFLMYPNLGVVYNIIAKYTVNNEVKEVAYIPAVSYGCSPLQFTENGCLITYSFEGRTFLFILSIYGFMIAFFGYSCVGPVVFFHGLLSSFLIGFILTGRYLSFSRDGITLLSILLGILGGLLCLTLWVFLRNPVVLLLFNGLVFGFLLTAVVLYTPIGNAEIFLNDKNFWSILTIGTLLVTVLSVALPTMFTIMGSSVVGSYVTLLFYDLFVGTRLSYIILNIIKRAVSKNLSLAFNDFPFEAKDIIMSSLWVFLSLFAMFVWYRKLRQDSNASGVKSVYLTPYSVRSHANSLYLHSEYNSSENLLRRNSNSNYQTFS